MECVCGRIIEGNPSDHICGTGKLTREARKLQQEMKRIQEKLLDSHSVEERNSLLAPETKHPTTGMTASDYMESVSREIRKGGIGHNKVVPGGIPEIDEHGDISLATPVGRTNVKSKPYIVTIEVDAHNLDEAKAAAFAMASGDGGGNWSGEVTSVVQKYRMTNFGTEWYKK